MKISKRIIPILKGSYNEHGSEETQRRMDRILNLNLRGISKKEISFTDNIITIHEKNPLTIVFFDDYYYAKRDYSTYSTYVFYDDEGYEFRKATSYKTNNGILVLDRIDAEQLENTRIIKTTEDDVEFLNGYYEKEMMSVPKAPIEESSTFIEYSNDDIDSEKIMKIGTNMYYHHLYSLTDEQRFLETASCIDIPVIQVKGRTRNENDLLTSSEEAKLPNIFMRGNTVDDYKSTTSYYDLSIYKLPKEGLMSIKIDIVNQLDGSLTHKNHVLEPLTTGPINKFDMEHLIRFFTFMDYPFKQYVIEELRRLSDKLAVHNMEKVAHLDSLDLEIMMYSNYNELAFHIYENLGAINEFIEKQTHREVLEERKKLMN